MERISDPKSSSCIPCAKRKVRCDRLQPCSHCKRRKDDDCQYPFTKLRSERPALDDDDVSATQQDQHGSLEQQGSDSGTGFQGSYEATRIVSRSRTSPITAADSVGESPLSRGTKRAVDGTPRSDTPTIYRAHGSLVEQTSRLPISKHLSGTAGMKQESSVTSHTSQSREVIGLNNLTPKHLLAIVLHCWTDQMLLISVALIFNIPSRETVHALWNTFLANVHPVVKIFFAWEKAPLLDIYARDPTSLTSGQQALCFSIFFIAISSLSEGECESMVTSTFSKDSVMDDFQSDVETTLFDANYASTSDLLVLQALILYLTAMRNRAKAVTCFSLMGIAVRIAQRLGLHRDGDRLGLSPMRAEERRRIWWQMQHLEISISQLVGCISMTLYGYWDTKIPANLDDDDFSSELETVKPERIGLTSMSHCLWRYSVLVLDRERRASAPEQGWHAPDHISSAMKDAVVEHFRRTLAEKFLQHCELLEPLHLHIQIGIQNFLLALQRAILQPEIASARISEMPQNDRDEFLKICMKCMEYYILAQATPSIAHLRWHSESYFQWTALVYILIEAHHRAADPEASALWTLINRVCELHPKITTAIEFPEVYAVANLVVRAWQPREKYLQGKQAPVENPWCVDVLERALSIRSSVDDSQFESLDFDFDFDLIDWSHWEMDGFR